MKIIARRLAVIARISLWLSGLGLVLMTAFIAWQVFGRFVLNDTPTWTESISVLLMGWFIFLGAAVGIREAYHLSFDILLHVMSDRIKRWMHTASDLSRRRLHGRHGRLRQQLVIGTRDSTIPNIGLPSGVNYLSIVGGGCSW